MMHSHSQNNIPKWCKATLVARDLVAANIVMLRFEIATDSYVRHVAGQYYDLRVVLPSGVISERSYSVANAPNDKGIVEFGVQLIENGEVSPYLWNLVPGETTTVELRGPSGGFIWNPFDPKFACNNLILIGGGSGMVPLMGMLRQYVEVKKSGVKVPGLCTKVYVVLSATTITEIPYHTDLQKIIEEFPEVNLNITVTNDTAGEWEGNTERINGGVLRRVLGDTPLSDTWMYICGRNTFVDKVTSSLVLLGYSLEGIESERFG